MKKLSRILTAILLLATIGPTLGCEKVDNPVISELEISPDYVPIDWEEATLISSDDSAGTYQIQFSGTVPDIHPGSIITIDELTCMPQIVKFEADDLLSSEYGIARQGVASVTWTPSSANDVLYAKLYDISGNVIAMDAVNASPASIAQLVTGSNFNAAIPTSATAVRFEYNSNVSSGTLLSTSSSSVPIYGNMQGNTWVVSTSASTINANPSCKYMFSGRTGLTSIDFGNGFNTSSVTDMSRMFYDCRRLTSLDVSNFNTSSVTNMGGMFYFCSGLTSLNLSNFNTSSVRNMMGMFCNCWRLTSLDVSNFNTSSVTDMGLMFGVCSGLTSLDVSNFNTSSVTNMSWMFLDCSGLTSLNLSNFNTSSVTDMSRMFASCSGLTSLNLSNFNTSSVTNMGYMFYYCRSLTSLNLYNFNTANVTDMSWMFSGCDNLSSLNLYNFDMTNVTNKEGMCYYLATSSGDCTITCPTAVRTALESGTNLPTSGVTFTWITH